MNIIEKSISRIKRIIAIINEDGKIKKQSNEVIADYKYIHVMFNDKFCTPFVRFINTNFDVKEHLFLIKQIYEQFVIPEESNVVKIDTLYGIRFNDKNTKIIMHSLLWDEMVFYSYLHKKLLKEKVYWMMWGGDLYDARRTFIDDYVRRNCHGYISDTDGDCDLVSKKYKIRGNKKYHNAAYTFPITFEMVDKAISNRKEHDYIQIQINNSSDKSTLEMLDVLKKFSKENIRIVTVLSYGDLSVKDDIISLGRKNFGDKFLYLDNYLTPEEYAAWIAENDIYILNQDRQQGLGNSFAALASGAKLYIKSFVTTYNHFNKRDIRVYDTLKIRDLSFEKFVEYADDQKKNNEDKVKIFFKDEYIKKCWEQVFNG